MSRSWLLDFEDQQLIAHETGCGRRAARPQNQVTMNGSFDFVSTEDKPALIAFSTPEWLEAAKAALDELGYKVHTAATHSDFLVRFSQAHYQVVIVEIGRASC